MTRPLRALIFIVAFATAVAPSPGRAQTFDEYPIPSGATPVWIAAGPDGNLWFTESDRPVIGTVTVGGTLTEHAVPATNSRPVGITSGPDGNVWIADQLHTIWKVTSDFVFTSYTLPPPFDTGAAPWAITNGGVVDGRVWFTSNPGQLNFIGAMSSSGGDFTYTDTLSGSSITAGPDGNLWVTELIGRVARITPAGVITEYDTSNSSSCCEYGADITIGGDGNLWFTEPAVNKIGTITIDGVLTEYDVPTPSSGPAGITLGPDGNVWFAEGNANQIAMVTISGAFTEYTIPSASTGPFRIASGGDGRLWFTEVNGHGIGRLSLPAPTATASPTPIETATSTSIPTSTATPAPLSTVSAMPICAPKPETGCRQPVAPRRSRIVLGHRVPEGRDHLTWKWKGEPTLKSDFGDPSTTTNYAVCIYDRSGGVATLALAAAVRAGGICAGAQCWKESPHGFSYADKDATPDGVVLVSLKEGVGSPATIRVEAKGTRLALPSLPLAQDPTVTVQLTADAGICWGADYSVPATKNTQADFRDASD